MVREYCSAEQYSLFINGLLLVILYTLTIFVSATLLFLVQPMFARQVLPMLGGSPAVWNTAMVFYQATLLLGYAYAHFSTQKLGVRKQSLWHLGLLVLPVFVLPLAIPAGWTPPTQGNPVLWMLGLMAVAVGLPFFVVSASSPLLQRWLAGTDLPAARDPYFLYAASNAGSLLALFAYPIVVEPYLSLKQQTTLWSGGYFVFAALTAFCIFQLRRAAPAKETEETATPRVAIAGKRRARWILLAFAPSSLMLSVTTYLSTDLAAVPLLWVIPLGLYLLSFILVFAARPPIRPATVRIALACSLVVLSVMVAVRVSQPLIFLVPLHLMTFFLVALMCHGQLAEDRPAARDLTEFYLWMSLGGVLGGAFNALLAPVLFRGITEYPIALILVAALFVWPRIGDQTTRQKRLDWILPAALALLTWGLVVALQTRLHLPGMQELAIVFGLPTIICLGFARRPLRFALGLAAILGAGAFYFNEQGQTLYAARSFFGVHRIMLDNKSEFHQIVHGGTLHGRQFSDPNKRGIPLTYYGKSGPIGDVFSALSTPAFPKHVGLIGLGAGTLAAYGKKGQDWTFYEIDPLVEKIARDPRYFTYLQDSAAKPRVVIGDARLSIKNAPPHYYDILIVDAYSSDAIPIHLSTREALQLYLEKLAPNGVMAFHISNRHLDLEPMLGNLARELRLVARTRNDNKKQNRPEGVTASEWVVMARRKENLGALAKDARWKITKTNNARLWTDDYSSILSVFQWK